MNNKNLNLIFIYVPDVLCHTQEDFTDCLIFNPFHHWSLFYKGIFQYMYSYHKNDVKNDLFVS